MDHADPQPSPRNEWYYELGGRTHGPVSRNVLEDLLSRSGDTAVNVRIRQGADGTWTSYRGAGVDIVVNPPPPGEAATPPPAAFPRLTATGHQTGGARRALSGLLRHVPVIAAIGLWVLANVVLLFFWPQPHGAERRAVLALEEIETKMNDLRRTRASDGDWSELSQRSKATLAPIVKDLQKAPRSEPVQLLLVACRDMVPKLCGPQTPQRQNDQWRLRRCIQRAELVLSGLDTD